ncbi:MAG TPA: acyl-CoA dehydrogenase family protein [Vicinamibacterales bacterium]|nr:acyl-CoA dehydrogenase family protein [Vicinamibacterales bacterium]
MNSDHVETPAAPSHLSHTSVESEIDESLVARARALAPIIRQHAETTERERRLARPVLQAMRDAGLFRMFTPRTLGGLETDPITAARVAEEIASVDSAAGWALQAGNTGSWWAGHFPESGVAELYAGGPDLIMAASFAPPHRAESVPGGYRFSGRGALASTIHDSPWVLMTGIVFDGDQPRTTPFGPMMVALALRTSEMRIIDTWQSLGMRGTDSNDVAADGVFVPEARSFIVAPAYEPAPQFGGPLYRLPALASADVVIAPVALAIARSAITAIRDIADRKTPLASTRTIRHRSAVQFALADAEAQLRAARLLFYEAIATAWQRALANQPATLVERADLMLASAHAVRASAHVADLMHRMGGTNGIYERNHLERHFRDAQTVRHHGFLSEARLETVGQVYLGVEPEFGFVAF